jgi:hypothetical protein
VAQALLPVSPFDFTEWEPAVKFKEEFNKLVRDLKKAQEADKNE